MRTLLHFLPAILLLGGAAPTSGQHQADKWYFGYVGEGLDFSQECEPVVLYDGAILGWEGVSSISDPMTGDLLFYTNSEWIWNKDHQHMPNGYIQPIGVTQSQNTITQVLSVPFPGNDSLYYVFTNQIQGGFGGFGMRLACVDISLNAGNGDVIFKDSIIYAEVVSEKLTAVPHANSTDIWVVGHEDEGNSFFAFLIGNSGLQFPPIISTVGKIHSGMDHLGEMKASPDGTKLAVATSEHSDIELFDFDRSNGTISNPIRVAAPPGLAVPQNSWWYGVSFSPDNSKLYAGKQNFGDGTQSIIQVDVSSSDSAIINASKVVISTLDSVFSLQLAPNGKIYTRRSGNYLGALNNPNADGLACDFDPYAIDFGEAPGGFAGVWGLNNYIALEDYPCLGTAQIAGSPKPPDAFTIQPGPMPGVFTIRVPLDMTGSLHLEIADMRGATVYLADLRILDGSTTMNVRHLNAGVYLVSAFVGRQRIGASRIVLTE